MTPLLQVTDLARYFGGLKAVNGLSFTLDNHQIMGLIGPNGAGKTTAFNLISGTTRPSRGSVKFKGEEIVGRRPSSIVRLGLARTFQATSIYSNVTVRENILRGCFANARVGFLQGLFNTHQARNAQQRAAQRSDELIELLSLQAHAQQRAGSLAYGYQRRLGVAIALATQPQLLLLDEPVAGLNPEESAQFGRLLRNLAQAQQLSILLVEHHMRLVMEVCDRIVVLDHGEKIGEGTPQEISRNPVVIQAYLGTPEDADA